MQGHFNGIFSRFIGEESVAGGLKCELTHDPTWVIDPIDGTTNFVHSNPHICTILAFMVEQVQSPKFKRVSLNKTREFPFWGLNIYVDFDFEIRKKWKI